jgi:hypothetical protein
LVDKGELTNDITSNNIWVYSSRKRILDNGELTNDITLIFGYTQAANESLTMEN